MSAQRFPVEAGHILLFARAVGDPDPVWAGALHGSEPVPAPPTFVQASAQFDPDYSLRPRIGAPWLGSGHQATGTPRGGAGGGSAAGHLHAEQHYTYHRPLRSGVVLSATTQTGRSWEKQGRRGGKLIFSEMITEYCDEAGELIVTARSVGVGTEKVVTEGAATEGAATEGAATEGAVTGGAASEGAVTEGAGA